MILAQLSQPLAETVALKACLLATASALPAESWATDLAGECVHNDVRAACIGYVTTIHCCDRLWQLCGDHQLRLTLRVYVPNLQRAIFPPNHNVSTASLQDTATCAEMRMAQSAH